ncbi:MAG: hypothetical protein R2838_08335 [Caldilineaceae bacterium]
MALYHCVAELMERHAQEEQQHDQYAVERADYQRTGPLAEDERPVDQDQQERPVHPH